MIEIAEESLAPIIPTLKAGFTRSIQRAPLGVVFDLPAWNFPYLTAVNAMIPALMAGNAVVLKHATQTALCADRLADAARAADLPEGLFATLDLTYAHTEAFVRSGAVDFVCFTGSVFGGQAIERAATESQRFLGVGLELGGKDAAYVRADADLGFAVENVVDGAMFNSGQSCCGIERVYVHRDLYEDFVEGAVALIGQYRLGDPRDADTNLGPMARGDLAENVRRQINDAVKAGATALIDPESFPKDAPYTPYLAPQLLTGVTHDMEIMREETFGPVIGVMPVDSDEHAIQLMNDSRYGLTASLWTNDISAASAIAPQLEFGTVFMNRCDYLDPGLAWTGVKDTGRGTTLSKVGYEALTRPQSWHFRHS
jgi:acyl-CoA reductase-like NAD-dependent aldehyde dehydrogenase